MLLYPSIYLMGDQTKLSFRLNNDEIRAGGVLLYRVNEQNKQIEFLLAKNGNRYEDLGGKIDKCDADIYETIAREVKEESNNLINYNSIILRIKENNPIFVKYSKYMLFIIESNNYERDLTSEMFGIREIHDNIDRTVHWISFDDFFEFVKQKKINPRLANKGVYNALNLLKNTGKIQINIKDIKKNINYLF